MAGRLIKALSNRVGSVGVVRPRNVVTLVTVLSVVALAVGAQSSSAATPDFTIAAAPLTQTLAPGQTTAFFVEVGAVDGFNSSVALSVTGLPAGVTASFAPAAVTAPGGAIVTIAAGATAGLGTFEIAVTGKSGALTHTSNAGVKVDFALVPKCVVAVKGTVTDASAAHLPINGATISVGGKSATTTAAGAYSVAGVELGANNAAINLTVSASKDSPAASHIGTYWPKSSTGVGVCGRDTTVNLQLTESVPAQVSGSIVEGEIVGGDYTKVVAKSPIVPVSGATAAVGSIATATSDAAGAVVFKDNTGRAGIRVNTENAALTSTLAVTGPIAPPVRHRFWNPTSRPIGPIAAGSTTTFPAVALLRQCTAAISGTVTDVAGGAAIAGAQVSVKPVDTVAGDSAAVTTGADGKYSVPEILFGYNNKPGKLNVTVTKSGYTTTTVQSAIVGCGDTATSAVALTQTSTKLYGSVTGRVVDKETGVGIPGITVTFSACVVVTAGDCSTSPTDANGNYAFNKVPVGATVESTLTGSLLAAPGGALPTHWLGSVPITVAVGAVPSPAADIQLLKRRFGAANGQVVDAANQLPLAGVAMSTSAAARVACGPPCLTDPAGKYSFSGVELNTNNAVRTTTITAGLAGYWSRTVPVTYEADTNKEIGISLVKVCATTKLEGTVVNAATQLPLPDATVTTSNPGGTPANLTVKTDANGHYAFTGLLAGTNNVTRTATVSASATGFYGGSLSTTIGCGGQLELNFGVRPTVGSITPVTGPAAGGTEVTINGTDLAGIVMVTFDGVPATAITPVSTSQAKATTPPHLAGVVDVQVTTDGGNSAVTTATKFTYTGAPPSTTSTSTTTTSSTSTTSTTVPPTSTTTTSSTSTTTTTSTTVPPTSTTTSTTVPGTTTTTTKPTTTTTTSTTVPPTTTTTSTTTTTKPTTTTTTSTTVPPTTTTTTKPTTTTTTAPPTTTTTIPSPTTTVPPAPAAGVVVAVVLWLILLLLFGGGG